VTAIADKNASERRMLRLRVNLGAYTPAHIKGALQLLCKRYRYIRFAHVHERVSTESFGSLVRGNLKSNHVGAQGRAT